jgi:DNA-binding SARP family transcriptional activator
MDNVLILKLLGAPGALYSGRPVAFRTRKTFALLSYLAVEGGYHTREKLTSLFWPDKDNALGRASLRNTLSYVQSALRPTGGGQSYVTSRGDSLGISPGVPLLLDTQIIKAAQPAQSDASMLTSALEAYRGDFLEGFSLEGAPAFDDWAIFQREYWHRRMEIVFDRLSRFYLDAGDTAGAIDTAARWVAHNSINESATRRLMQAYVAAGDPPASLAAYEALHSRLDLELRTTPSPETEALAARIRASTAIAARANPVYSTGKVNAAVAPSTDPAMAPLTLVDSPLVGRMAEFMRLAEIWGTAREGQALAVTLEGEGGIGKTRLAREFLNWIVSQGGDILQARAFEVGGQLPFAALIEALRPRIDLENAPDDLISDVWLTELNRLLPELRERYPDLPPAAPDEAAARPRLFEAVARLVQAFAERAPVLLFIDDIQWIDADSLDLLHYCARRWTASKTPLLLLMTMRSEARSTRPELNRWLLQLGRELPAYNLAMGPLTHEETARFVHNLGTGDPTVEAAEQLFARWIFTETRGQPFYLVETLKALLEGGLLTTTHNAMGESGVDFSVAMLNEAQLHGFLPPGVREVIRVRLGRLSPVASNLLVAGATLGREFRFDTLCNVAGLGEIEGLPALDEVLSSHLIRESGSAADTVYTFSHDKIRDVIYSEAGEARRRVFHKRALDSLESAGTAPALLAHHAKEAGMPEQAIRFSLAAGLEAMQMYATGVAVTYLEQARCLLKDQVAGGRGAPPMRPLSHLAETDLEQLYTQLGRAYELTSRTGEAQGVFEEMLTLARGAGARHLECIALNRLATRSVQDYSDLKEAKKLLEEALRVATVSEDSEGLAETEWNLAHILFYGSDVASAYRHAGRALQLARDVGSPQLIARSLNAFGYATGESYRSEESARYGAEAQSLYRQLGDRAMEVDSLCLVSKARFMEGNWQEGLELARTALTLSTRIDNSWGQVNSNLQMTLALLDAGQYEQAFQSVETATQLVRKHNIFPISPASFSMFGAVLRTLFDLPAAIEVHKEMLDRVDSLAIAPFKTTLAAELCADYALSGDWEQAYRYALVALETRENRLHFYTGLTYWLETEALARAGALDMARKEAARFKVRVFDSKRYYLPHSRAMAVLALVDGQEEEALDQLKAARGLALEMHLPGELWPIEAEMARIYTRQGRLEEAQAALERARAIIQMLAGRITNEQIGLRFLTGAEGLLGRA